LNIEFGIRVFRVHDHGEHGGVGCQLAHHLQALWSELVVEEHHAGDIAAWTVDARHDAKFDRVGAGRENDRNGGRRGFSREH
jgi:hypothetical protein